MALEKVQVRVIQPLVGEALREENELRRTRTTLDAAAEALQQRLAELEVELESRRDDADALTNADDEKTTERVLEAMTATSEKLTGVQKELDAVRKEQEQARAELERRLKERLIVIDVQTAAFGGRLRQMEAAAAVDEWVLAQKRKALGVDEDAEEQPGRKELDGVRLNDQQREDYVVMSTCTAIVGAVCRDEDGRPVVTGMEWPEEMYDWTEVPAYIIEPTLMQVYALNPSWSPDWLSVGTEDNSAKNA